MVDDMVVVTVFQIVIAMMLIRDVDNDHLIDSYRGVALKLKTSDFEKLKSTKKFNKKKSIFFIRLLGNRLKNALYTTKLFT